MTFEITMPLRRILQGWRQLAIATILGFFSATSGCAALEPGVQSIAPPSRILFVGNSFTYYNDSLHNHLRNLMHVSGRHEQGVSRLRAMTISGARLHEHAAGLRTMVTPGNWDVVVLQGHSTELAEPESARAFARVAAVFDKHIRKNGARTVLFMTWAYKDKPDMLKTISHNYTATANALQVLVAPVGHAFAHAAGQHPHIDLYSRDIRAFVQPTAARDTGRIIHDPTVKHPSLAGSYLAACVFYVTLFSASPVGLAYDAGLDTKTATLLQTVAWDTVRDFHGDEQGKP